MRWILLCPLLMAASPAPPEAPPEATPRLEAQRAVVTLKVVHPLETRQALVAAVEKAGGFPVLVTAEQLQVKVPPEAFAAVLAEVKQAGVVVDQHLERQDRTEQVAQLVAQLKAKQEILERLRGLFNAADLSSTLRIEQELLQLVTEIEQVKGQLRVQGEQTRWAVIDVSFRFRQRDRITYQQSPFAWLNSVHLDRFLGEF